MIEALAEIGRQLLESDQQRIRDQKEALITRMVEKSLVEERKGKNSRENEPKLREVVIDLDYHEITFGQTRKIEPGILENFRYIFERTHSKRTRPRLTLKKIDALWISNRKQNPLALCIDKIEELEKKSKSTTAMLELKKALEKALHIVQKTQKNSLHDPDSNLFTIVLRINDDVVTPADKNCHHILSEGYKDLLYKDIRLEYNAVSGKVTCYLCGYDKEVVIDPDFPSGSLLKTYITDQPGFISGLPNNEKERDKKLLRTFSLCPDCLSYVLVGYKFVEQTHPLSSPLIGAKMNLYVIPRSHIPIRKIEKWLSYIKVRWSAAASYDALNELDEKIRDYYEEEEVSDSYYLTLIFGTRSQASFKFYGMYRDAPLTKIAAYTQKAKQIHHVLNQYVGEFKKHTGNSKKEGTLYPSFQNIAEITPLRISDGSIKDASPLITILGALLKGYHPSSTFIPKLALTVASIHYFGVDRGYTVKPNKVPGLCSSIILYNLLDYLINVLNGEREAQKAEISFYEPLPEHLQTWLKELGYDEWKSSLFLLGYVIGEVGAYQIHQRGSFGEFPPIVKKIPFDGINRERLKQLCLDIAEAMKNYNVISKDVLLAWSQAQLGIEKHLKEMNDPISNAYHILSGYAYATLRRLTGRRRKEIEGEMHE